MKRLLPLRCRASLMSARGGFGSLLPYQHPRCMHLIVTPQQDDEEKKSFSQLSPLMPINMPGLSSEETLYVNSQLSYFSTLTTDHLLRYEWEKTLHSVRQVFPHFLKSAQTKLNKDFYKCLTKNLIITQRTARALHNFGITHSQLERCPSLLKKPLFVLPGDLFAGKLLDSSLADIASRNHKKRPLRGIQIRNLTQDVFDTLKVLGMRKHGLNFERVAMPSEDAKNFFTLDDFNRRVIVSFITSTFPDKFASEAVDILTGPQREKRSSKSMVNAKDFIRNFWLFYQLVGDDVFTENMLNRLSFHVCPLESLIKLNDCYRILSNHLTFEEFRDYIASSGIHHLTLPSFKFPFSLRKTVLNEIGFTDVEAKDILMSNTKNFSEHPLSTQAKPNRLELSSPLYISTMQKRLELLRKNGPTLGLVTASEYFSVMTKWCTVMQSLKSICDKNAEGQLVRFNRSKLEIFEYSRNSRHPAYKFLIDFFDCKTTSERASLKKDAFVHSNQLLIPVREVIQILDFLQEKGFSKLQIRNALPLLFYPLSLIKHTLSEMPDLKQDNPRILHCCLYFLEKEFNFTGNGLWFDLKIEICEEMHLELQKESIHDGTPQDSPKFKASETLEIPYPPSSLDPTPLEKSTHERIANEDIQEYLDNSREYVSEIYGSFK